MRGNYPQLIAEAPTSYSLMTGVALLPQYRTEAIGALAGFPFRVNALDLLEPCQGDNFSEHISPHRHRWDKGNRGENQPRHDRI